AWSYDLLSPEERALFRQLAVFVGGFQREAAEALVSAQDPVPSAQPAASTPGDAAASVGLEQRPSPTDWALGTGHSTLDLLASLLDKSLLQRIETDEGEARFGMLETIREFGLERLAATGEKSGAHAAHAAYFIDLARQTERGWFGSGFGACLARWKPERDNLCAALNWLEQTGAVDEALELAARLGFFWYYSGPVGEGRSRLERLVASAASSPAAPRALGWQWASNLARKQGDADRAIALAINAVATARESGDIWCLGLALCCLGGALREEGRAAETRGLFEEAWAHLRAPDREEVGAVALLNLGLLAAEDGEVERATTLCTEALQIRLRHANDMGAAIVRHALADLARSRGAWGKATALYRENLTVYRTLGDLAGIADSIAGIVLNARNDVPMQTAVNLLATASTLREMTDASIHSALQPDYDTPIARARAALGETAFDMAWATGRDVPPEQAMAVALGEKTGPAFPDAFELPPVAPDHGLSPRELDVLRLVAEGRTDQQIAEILFVSRRTVTSHVTNILSKLDLPSRTAAAAFAVRHDLA
ncbi:MAG: LuxR C-terminal-related transcriptional regulator, partial [Thermomicrobiales bacterium]